MLARRPVLSGVRDARVLLILLLLYKKHSTLARRLWWASQVSSELFGGQDESRMSLEYLLQHRVGIAEYGVKCRERKGSQGSLKGVFSFQLRTNARTGETVHKWTEFGGKGGMACVVVRG